ncbi:hypothetical protein HHK36_004227 [Tetracentron sinense]|uniref:PGG domain-containing protein n=1 Tax=Tetracentron sinense TaxID=13715 RepID=A0A834ZQ81_TETSI|nr:hypothetical protein HHK36_004227 [Tetracentron sinense]
MGSFMEVPNGIVPEVLRTNNYENWKVWMKSYLLGQGLWDIVDGTESKPEPTEAEFQTWRQKNGKALYAIQVSCVPHMFCGIKDTDSAEAAWNILALNSSQVPEVTLTDNEGNISIIMRLLPPLGYVGSGIESLPLDYARYSRLYNAVAKGEWENTKSLLVQYGSDESVGISTATDGRTRLQVALCIRISAAGDTPLHIAVLHKQVKLVEELVELMPVETLELENKEGSTALSLAAEGGITRIAKAMVGKNANLLGMENGHGLIPVTMAAINGHRDMVNYLYLETPDELLINDNADDGIRLLNSVITADMYDVAFDLLRRCPHLGTDHSLTGFTALKALARKPAALTSGSQLSFWKRLIYSVPGIKPIYDEKLKRTQALELLKCICPNLDISSKSKLSIIWPTLFDANEFGNVEFFKHMIDSFPILIHAKNENNQSIFLSAILHRQEGIFNLLNGMMQKQSLGNSSNVNTFHNNMLHQAGMLAPFSRLSTTTGAAMQMQRELQWFQEVEKHVPWLREAKNFEFKTPRALFTEQHKNLLKEGEIWMKGTATSCMVVATLIATVVFAAAFTVPGGNASDEGIPIFLKHTSFMVFVVSDALSLVSSSTSLLVFLSIVITSRYAEEDFLKALPKRLIIGLATLFFSIVTMMVAFVATLFIVLHERISWVAIPVSALASVPVTLYILLQFPLFWEMVTSTYGSGIFNPKTKRLF